MDENQDIDTTIDIKSDIVCDNSHECNCPECQCGKKRYIHIIDYDEIIENLNDWD